jgi:hypothetical protein
MEGMSFLFTFKKRKLFIHLEGYIPEIAVRIGVREGKCIHRSKGILDGTMSVTKYKEQDALEDE